MASVNSSEHTEPQRTLPLADEHQTKEVARPVVAARRRCAAAARMMDSEQGGAPHDSPNSKKKAPLHHRKMREGNFTGFADDFPRSSFCCPHVPCPVCIAPSIHSGKQIDLLA